MTVSDKNGTKSCIILYYYYQVDNKNQSQEHFNQS